MWSGSSVGRGNKVKNLFVCHGNDKTTNLSSKLEFHSMVFHSMEGENLYQPVIKAVFLCIEGENRRHRPREVVFPLKSGHHPGHSLRLSSSYNRPRYKEIRVIGQCYLYLSGLISII